MKYLLLPAVIILITTATSCRKVFDYISHHPDDPVSICRIDTIRVKHYNPFDDVLTVTYNKKGDPVTVLSHSRYSNGGQYFRYDLLNRLTDYIQTDIWDTGQATYSVLLWHKYGYPRPGFITDTSFTNFGDAARPAPNAADAPQGYYIVGYTFDAHGRLDRYWGVSKDPHQPPTPGYKVPYDANGNLPLPTSNPGDTVLYYDNKVNPYRTNKVWQFVYQDYSRNNVLRHNPPFILIYPPTVYNDIGLPLDLPNLNPLGSQQFNLLNSDIVMNITYACSMPKGPIDY